MYVRKEKKNTFSYCQEYTVSLHKNIKQIIELSHSFEIFHNNLQKENHMDYQTPGVYIREIDSGRNPLPQLQQVSQDSWVL